MLPNTLGWSHARGNEVVPSPWQATTGAHLARTGPGEGVGQHSLSRAAVEVAGAPTCEPVPVPRTPHGLTRNDPSKAREFCDRAARGCMRSAYEGRDRMTAMRSARDRLAAANTLALQPWVSTEVSTLIQSGSLEGRCLSTRM